MTQNADRIGPWRVKSRRTAFENPWIKIEDHRVVHPDGSPGEYGVVRFHNLAIGVLPIAENGDVWLVGQHRFPLDRYSWELPEGGGPIDDDPLRSAKRELSEETGLTAKKWLEISSFDVSNSVTDEQAICYLAWDLAIGGASPDPSESLTIKRVSFGALLAMIASGEVRDSLTVIMALTAQFKALRGDLPAPICRVILAANAPAIE
jgi:8-oxo-dGTP pyrophosphatase MutT (NUDIX family)